MLQKHLKIVVIFIFLLGLPLAGKSQTPISGVINHYAKVVSVDEADKVSVSSVAGFQVGDTVLIIQMKGAEIDTDLTNLAAFGTLHNINSAGKYEFLLISAISGTQVTFTADLLASYDPDGMVQLIKVPAYNEANVNGVLTGNSWDSATGTGGVLALIVNKTLTLEADIDMSGLGFKGGLAEDGDGNCSDTDISYENTYFNAASVKGAFKGEGSASYTNVPVLLGTDYSKGHGAIFQGGGGGNGDLSGGGGGANIGAGGSGGWEPCTSNISIGGKEGWGLPDIVNWVSENRIFMGGGGGAGTQSGGAVATDGGIGGGIVIIMADSIIVNIADVYIKSNGDDVPLTNTGGGGGGGAGGAIIVSVDNVIGTGSLHMEVTGGNGGVVNCAGPGGGGGGGLIWYSNSTDITVIDTILDGGDEGATTSGCGVPPLTAREGEDGITEPGLVLPLNGFLFNSIYSSRTISNTDTICEGDIPPEILGTKPKGGTPPYDFEWESSTDKLIWNLEAQGALFRNYTPSTPLVDTTYFRRTIRDNSVPIMTDISKILTIIVQPRIENNLITFSDTFCSKTQPDTIFASPKLPTGGNGPGSYTYLWEKSLDDGTTWMDTIQNKDKYYYVPPVMDVAIITDVYYRRIVSSGIGCPDTSTSGKVIYLDTLVNKIYFNQWICDGEQPDILTTDPSYPVSGGSGHYVYKWYNSDNGVDTIPGVIGNTVEFYPPALINGTSSDKSFFYLRKIISGACKDLSNSVEIVVHPLISGNTITADQTICKGTAPAELGGSVPPVLAGGDGTNYTYRWIESIDDITYVDVAGATAAQYSPGNLDVKTYFQREVTSTFSVLNNKCIDTTTVPVIIDIHPTYTADLADLSTGQDTVCYGTQGKLSLTLVEIVPGSNGPWTILLDDSDGNTWPSFSSNGTEDILVDANHSFTGATAEATIQYTFNSITDKFGCVPVPAATDTGSIVIVRPPVATSGGNQVICGLGPANLNATLGFGTGLWTGPIGFTDPANPITPATASNQGVYTLTWTTSNGICPDATDLADYTFWDTPSAAQIIPDVTDTTLAAFIKDINLSANAYLTGDINWTFNFGGGSFSVPQGSSTVAQGMDSGENEILLTISSGGGDCPQFDQTDLIKVVVQEDPFISKGMSPEDKTGGNDYFYIENIENVENELTIFNKLGTVLFQIDNYSCSMIDNSNCWDGRDKSNNPLPDGTYYYVLKIKGSNPQTVTGYFVIKGN